MYNKGVFMNQLHIEKFIPGGQGLGRVNGKVVFAWNGLPGEEVEVEFTKQKRTFAEGIARNVLKPSSERVEPRCNHWLSCSPWQVLDWQKEHYYKGQLARETYRKIAVPDLFTLVRAEDPFEYRNKMEYSFGLNDGCEISLAFFERGSHSKLIPFEICHLARPEVSEAAQSVVEWLRSVCPPVEVLKSLIVRSDAHGNVATGLFVRDEIDCSSATELQQTISNFSIFTSPTESPASIIESVLYQHSVHELSSEILGTKLSYGLMSFFQVNPPMFEEALNDIKTFVEEGRNVVDYYSGVGSISIPLRDFIKSCVLVEENSEAAEYAKKNLESNNLSHWQAVCAQSEKALEYIAPETTVILDPPRAGLHPRVVKHLLEQKPPRIIYLSCDLATHARDIELLSPCYKPIFLRAYNFFPRTPHIEGLCILDRK